MKRNILFDSLKEIMLSNEEMQIKIFNINQKATEIIKKYEKSLNELSFFAPAIIYTNYGNLLYFRQFTTKKYTKFLTNFIKKVFFSPNATFTYKNLKNLINSEEKLLNDEKKLINEKYIPFYKKLFNADFNNDFLLKKINNNTSLYNDVFIKNTKKLFITNFALNNYAFLIDFLLKLDFVEAVELIFIKPFEKVNEYSGFYDFSENIEYLNKLNPLFFNSEYEDKYDISYSNVDKIIKSISLDNKLKFSMFLTIHLKDNTSSFKYNGFIDVLKNNKYAISLEENFLSLSYSTLAILLL